MAANDPLKITKEDILEKFLVTEKYGENGRNWPNITIAACKITWTDEGGNEDMRSIVYNSSGKHTERKLIEFLNSGAVKTGRNIEIEVYQNYSPCRDCAKAICEYINNSKGKAKITITFANFYKTHQYSYKKRDGSVGGNPQEVADANIKGLQGLYNLRKNVTLQLFEEHVWKSFLGMSQFFTEKDMKKCLENANSEERNARNTEDQIFWKKIFNGPSSVDETTSLMGKLKVSK